MADVDVVEVLVEPTPVITVEVTKVAVVEVIEQGPQGPPGPPGGAGVIHVQTTAAATWVIPHPLGRRPVTSCYDPSGERIYPDEHASTTSTSLVFATPMAGTAVLI